MNRISPPPQILLFDIGRVLIDIDINQVFAAWAPYSRLSVDEIRQTFRADLPYQRYERGEITADEYFAYLADTLQLDATHAQIEAGWNAIFIGEITQTRELIATLRKQIPCHAFSNTNALHLERLTRLYPALTEALDTIFTSNEIGLRKPERAAFDYVCRELEVSPDAILFFDDLAENVEAACDAGLRGVQVRSPADIEAGLRAHGVAW